MSDTLLVVPRLMVFVVLGACGSTSAPPKPPAPAPVAVRPARVVDERARRDEIVAAHRVIEEQQQDALAVTCDQPASRDAHARCLPSCYPTEPLDVRAGKKLAGSVEITHLVCEPASAAAGAGPFAIADEIEGSKLVLRAVHGRIPRAHRKGTWQAEIEKALIAEQRPPLARGDALVVSGRWRQLVHPLTRERLRCVVVSHFARLHHPVDGCGGAGGLACEATGNPAARGLNVVHYRLAEARRLQAAGKTTDCQQAALEAVAVSRGLPRWRQYAKLNVGTWDQHSAYRTRFDGTLDEDTLFALAAQLGNEAHDVYTACGGAENAPTTVTQEQSFHTCW